MVKIPERPDPTLDSVNTALEAEQDLFPPSGNIGFGDIGRCSRYIWEKVNATVAERHNSDSLRIFRSGHRAEALMAEDLRKVTGVTLHTCDPQRDEKQYKLDNLNGRFTGRLDGVILGLIQAPNTYHIWEHKEVNELKFKKLIKAINEVGEKNALKEWDQVYFAQAQSNMFHAGLDRHYLTVSTMGLRQVISLRTELDKEVALALIEKAKRILNMKSPPECTCDSWSKFRCNV